MYIINAKQKTFGSMLDERDLLMLRMQFRQLHAIGFWRECGRIPCNRANLYLEHEGEPERISLMAHVPSSPKSVPLIIFTCATGALSINTTDLEKLFPAEQFSDIIWPVLELIARAEQAFLKNDQWMWETQITRKTRRSLDNFRKLICTVVDQSNQPVTILGRNHHVRTFRKEGAAVAIYDSKALLIVRLSEDSFELGPAFSDCVEFDKILDNLIVNIRPDILKYRKEITDKLRPLETILKDAEQMWKHTVRNAHESARLTNPEAKCVVPEFTMEIERYVINRTNEHWTVTIPFGTDRFSAGIVHYVLGDDPSLCVMPNAFDALTALKFDIKGLVANKARLESTIREHIVKAYVDGLEAQEIKDLGVTEAEYQVFRDAFIVAKGAGYAGTFQTFSDTLKSVTRVI